MESSEWLPQVKAELDEGEEKKTNQQDNAGHERNEVRRLRLALRFRPVLFPTERVAKRSHADSRVVSAAAVHASHHVRFMDSFDYLTLQILPAHDVHVALPRQLPKESKLSFQSLRPEVPEAITNELQRQSFCSSVVTSQVTRPSPEIVIVAPVYAGAA